MTAAVHVSPYGGSWYPGRRGDLERLLDELFARSEERTGAALLDHPLGFVVPHAGLAYSGAVAADAYRHLHLQKPRRIVILGFPHRGGPAAVSIPDVGGYSTPLGEVPVDHETVAQLARHFPFCLVAEDEICDHSVEIQLPLLQRAAPGTPVVPLFVGHLDAARRDAAARILAGLCEPGTAFLVSSDLTHYGRSFQYQPFPVDAVIAERLSRLDHGLIEAAGSLDPEVFLAAVAEVRSTLCGVAPIALWLRTLGLVEGDEIFQQILDYQTSGDITGDYHHTVSYGALGYFPASAFEIGGEDQALLLESARETLARLRATHEPKCIPPRRVTPALGRRTGVFVSLHQGERLLGCVGSRVGTDPLAELVPEMTLRTALADPRFPTVLGVEGEIDIEISVLTPFKLVRDAGAFRFGEHGAWLELGPSQGLLLPQVAQHRNFTAARFLSALSSKAGLDPDAYRDARARLSVFRAQVFSSNKEPAL